MGRMLEAISIAPNDLPRRYFGHPAIEQRRFRRNDHCEEEIVFQFKPPPSPPLIPIVYHEEFRIARWGNCQRNSKVLPAVGVVNVKDLAKPQWKQLDAEPVIIQAQAILHRKAWITCMGGMRGLCAVDEFGVATAYIIMEPSTDYYQIMTKSSLMPKLVGEII